jgi:hypothetical protein
MSPLKASIITLSVIPEWFYRPSFVTPEWFYQGSTLFENQRKKQKHGFPIKDFGNDKKGMTVGGGFPAKFRE